MGVRERVAGLVLAVLVGAGLAACGGGDDGGLTRAELASRGNTVCKNLDTQVKEAAVEFQGVIDFSPEQMQALYKKYVPLVDKAIADFKALDAPEDLDDEYAAALDQIEKDRQTLVAATESMDSAQRFFDSGVDPFTASSEKLSAVGITGCSSGETDEGDAQEEGNEEPTTTSAPPESSTSTSAP